MRIRTALVVAALVVAGVGLAWRAWQFAPAQASRAAEAARAATAKSDRPPEAHAPGAVARERAAPALRSERGSTPWRPSPGPSGALPVAWWLDGRPGLDVRVGAHDVPVASARLDEAVLLAAAVGDRVSMPLPIGGSVDAVVQRKSEPQPGTLLIEGHLADLEQDYPVIVTVGPVRTFVNLTTPGGTWTGEFADGAGWLHFDDLEARLVDHSISDMRTPPAEEDS
jgi:hypothetical protein